jgi:hypothetical protein
MWLILMRFLGGLMIWATVILVNAALLFCAFLCFSLAGMIGKAGAGGAVRSPLFTRASLLPPYFFSDGS